jgi:aryl-alcohol dehydrogenase-like predicted oxidoreductase
MPLPTNPLGKNGPKIPRLGLGLAALGRPGYINLGHGADMAENYVIDAMERRTHRMLDLAYREGVRYFDVARSYGRGEIFLKNWLDEKQPDDVFVGSKWGYTYTADWQVEAEKHEVKEHSVSRLQQQWAKSKALLPYLKLYQIHSATLKTGVLDDKDVLTELAALKEKGIRIGLSVSGPEQADTLERAMLTRIDGTHLFDVVQATFNVLEQSMADSLRQAADSGMGIIVKEALANGRLTPRNQDADFAKTRGTLENMARSYDSSVDAIALAFVLAHPWAHVVLSGAAVEAHLYSNLSAAQLELSDDSLDHLHQFSESPDQYWQERSQLSWN